MSHTVDPSKRIALITGCSEINSLGAAFALDLLRRGWTVFATARNEKTLAPLAEAGCRTLALDVTSDESVAAAAKTVSTLTGGRLDLLINNVRELCNDYDQDGWADKDRLVPPAVPHLYTPTHLD